MIFLNRSRVLYALAVFAFFWMPSGDACFAGELNFDIDGTYPDIDARAGYLHVLYMGPNGAGVFYMRSDDGGLTWLGPMAVPGAGDANEASGKPAVAGDSQGRGHVTWSNGRNAAYYCMFDGSNFGGKETAISSKVVVEPDIGVDKNDVAHILAYVSDGKWFIGHSKNPGGAWEGVVPITDKISDALYGAPTVLGDDQGNVHGTWFQVGGGTIPHYARFDVGSNGWTDHVTLGPSHDAGDVMLAVDSNGYPRVAWTEYRNYYGWYVLGIMYNYKDQNGWHQVGKVSPGESLDEGHIYTTAGIATDSQDRDYISWQASDKLRYAAYDPSTSSWVIPFADVVSSSRQYWYSTCGLGQNSVWVYQDDRGLMMSWGNADEPPGPVQGDINGDGACNGADLIMLSRAFGSSTGQERWNAAADLDGNGVIDGNDLSILGGNFGKG